MTLEYSEAWREQGDLLARDPTQWHYYARSLLRSAEVCDEAGEAAFDRMESASVDSAELRMVTVALYLCAQSTELFLKALAVQRDAEVVRNHELYTHNLVVVARDLANVPNDELDEIMLGKLTKLIVWAGRYPIPRWDSKQSDWDIPDKLGLHGEHVIDANYFPWTVRWSAAHEFASKLDALFSKRQGERLHRQRDLQSVDTPVR